MNGYYSYVKRKPSLRERDNTELIDLIKKLYREGKCMYGSPRISGRLKNSGIKCSRKRVAKLMRKEGITAKTRKSWKKTTKQGKRKAAKNLLSQKFKVDEPNRT